MEQKVRVRWNSAILSKLEGGGADFSSPGPFPSIPEPGNRTTEV